MIDDAKAVQARIGSPTEQEAYDMGAKGGPICHEERKLFEAWMRGHCWKAAPWEDTPAGGQYTDTTTRMLWAVWRDRAALVHTAPVDQLVFPPMPKSVFKHPKLGEMFDRMHMHCYAARHAEGLAKLYDAVVEFSKKQIPEGWRLVPIVPTDEMRSACIHRAYDFEIDEDWNLMLEAAPAATFVSSTPEVDKLDRITERRKGRRLILMDKGMVDVTPTGDA